MRTDHEVVLLDLGGVLVELGGVGQMLGWTELDEAELWRRWLGSTAVRRFETGGHLETFVHEVITEFELPVSSEDFAAAFAAWPRGLLPGARGLLQELGAIDDVRLASLSNTNALHWPRMEQDFGLGPLFDDHFPSHLLGVLKPDREVFVLVIEELEVAPERVLYLDDNQLNVDAAREVGLDAHQAKGSEAARAVLAAHGLVAPGHRSMGRSDG